MTGVGVATVDGFRNRRRLVREVDSAGSSFVERGRPDIRVQVDFRNSLTTSGEEQKEREKKYFRKCRMLQSFNNEKSSNIALQQNSSGKKFRYLLHLFEILRNFKYLKS